VTRATRIGCAGWALGRATAQHFPDDGSHLQRYGRVFNCVEINSSFYRPHRPATYERWAASVPGDFRFSVKCPKLISHDLRLARASAPLDDFLGQVCGLGDKLGCLLLQLPPAFRFDRVVVQRFFALLRKRHAGSVVCEPRHPSWFSADAAETLDKHRIGRVLADPPVVAGAGAQPPRAGDVSYWRLHGSPRMYHSPYSDAFLCATAASMQAARSKQAWCIFDNTASGAAVPNALRLRSLLQADPVASP